MSPYRKRAEDQRRARGRRVVLVRLSARERRLAEFVTLRYTNRPCLVGERKKN